MRLTVSFAAALTLALTTAPAVRAWDSICSQTDKPEADVGSLVLTARGCAEGPGAARGRWRDPTAKVDEHRQIFAEAVAFAGLPSTLLDTQKLSVFVVDDDVVGLSGMASLKPRPLATDAPDLLGIKAVQRGFSLDELAQLPDFSFGLWDWASGNETCPLQFPTGDPVECHTFRTHMGAVNANHFPPQSDQWFTYYHELALARARVCTANRTAARQRAQQRNESVAAVDRNLKETWKACEVEALAYEAIGQHYLQDSWSAGHMWTRWGSSDMGDVTNLLDTLGPGDWAGYPDSQKRLMIMASVAAVAGTIHGSDAPFFDEVGATLHDPMCYPDPDVQAVGAGGQYNVVGDLHLHDLISGPDVASHADISTVPLPYDRGILQSQADHLLACAGGALGEVYAALKGADFEPALGPAPASPPSFDAAGCVAPRATNLAFFRGIFDDEVDPAADPTHILELTREGLGNWVVTTLGPWLARGYVRAPDSVSNRLKSDYMDLMTYAALRAKAEPNGIDLASAPGTMLGMFPNSSYAAPPSDDMADPRALADDAPFGAGDANLRMGTFPGTKAFWLTQTFHHARGPELCMRQDDGNFRVDIAKVIRAARAEPEPDAGDAEARRAYDARCQACAEWVAPFIWNTATWDGSKLTGAPLCSYVEGYPATKAMDGNPDAWGLEPDTALIEVDGADRRWFAHYPTQNRHDGPDPVPVGYESSQSYVGGGTSETPEQLAKLMCCAKLQTRGGTGNFRIHGTIHGQPADAVVTMFLTPADAPEIEAEDLDPDYEQPVLAHLPTGDPAKGVRALANDGGERFGLRYDTDPRAKAVYDTFKAVAGGGGEQGLSYNFGNPATGYLPAGTFRLTPLMAMDEKRGEHCTFEPASVPLTLNPDHAEAWDVDFTMTCASDTAFHIGYPRQFQSAIPVAGRVITGAEPYRRGYAQRIFVNGPVTLASLGLFTPGAAPTALVHMAVYKETAANFMLFTAAATMVGEVGPVPLADGANPPLPLDATLDKGTYWIVFGFDGDGGTIGYSTWRVGYGFAADLRLPTDGSFPGSLDVGPFDFRNARYNVFMNVQ